ELDDESGALRVLRVDEDLPARTLDDAAAHRETEAGAGTDVLRRHERIEDAGRELFRDAGAIVLDLEPHGGAVLLLRAKDDRPLTLERGAGVASQMATPLRESLRAQRQGEPWLALDAHRNRLEVLLRAHQVQRVIHAPRDRCDERPRGGGARLGARVVEQITD